MEDENQGADWWQEQNLNEQRKMEEEKNDNDL